MHEKSQTPELLGGVNPAYYLESADMLMAQIDEPSAELLAVFAVGSLALGDEQRALDLIDAIEQQSRPEQLTEVYLASIDLGYSAVQDRLSSLPTQLFHQPSKQADLLLGLIHRGINMDTNAEYARTVIDSSMGKDSVRGSLPIELVSVMLGTKDFAGAVVMTEHYFGDSASVALMRDAWGHLETPLGPLARRRLRKDVVEASNDALGRYSRALETDHTRMDNYTPEAIKRMQLAVKAAVNEFVPAFFAAALLAESGDEKSREHFKKLLVQQAGLEMPVFLSNHLALFQLPVCRDIMERSHFFSDYYRSSAMWDIQGVLSLFGEYVSGSSPTSLPIAELRDYCEAIYKQLARRQLEFDADCRITQRILDQATGHGTSSQKADQQWKTSEGYQRDLAREKFTAIQYLHGVHATLRHVAGQPQFQDSMLGLNRRALQLFAEIDLELADYVTTTSYLEGPTAEGKIGSEFQQHAVRKRLDTQLAEAREVARDLSSSALKVQLYIKILEGYAVLEDGVETLDDEELYRFNYPDTRFTYQSENTNQKNIVREIMFAAADCEALGHYPDYDRGLVIQVLGSFGIDPGAIERAKIQKLASNAEYSHRNSR